MAFFKSDKEKANEFYYGKNGKKKNGKGRRR